MCDITDDFYSLLIHLFHKELALQSIIINI